MSLKKKLIPVVLSVLCFVSNSVSLEAASAFQDQAVYRVTEQNVTSVAAEHFSGKAYVKRAFDSQGDRPYAAAYVTFEPGACTAWHYHPLGQTLIIMRGECWTQTLGGHKTVAHAGDVVWCPPGVVHYHGASPNAVMMHLAIAEKRDGVATVVWQDKVTDQEYLQTE